VVKLVESPRFGNNLRGKKGERVLFEKENPFFREVFLSGDFLLLIRSPTSGKTLLISSKRLKKEWSVEPALIGYRAKRLLSPLKFFLIASSKSISTQ